MNEHQNFIAYSLPGSTEYLLGTVGSIAPLDTKANIADYDFVIAPFDAINQDGFLVKFSSLAANRKFSCTSLSDTLSISTTKENYEKAFKEIKTKITEQKVEKVVLARQQLEQEVITDAYQLFITLKNKYPAAFTYILHTEETETWIGVSPELVLQSDKRNFLTRAIAGTKALSSEAPWSQKEILEHRFIETFYKEVLEKQQVDYELSETRTIPAGSICHICSDVIIKTQEDPLAIVAAIHPSPALSGYPRAEAMDIIAEVEQGNRSLYCGYLGPIGSDVNWYANIRCMQVYRNGLLLHLGGGITADSELESEWKETEMKAETLLSAFKAPAL